MIPPTSSQEDMATCYADIYEHSQVSDTNYKNNLCKQIEDVVLVEPDAYSIHDLEHLVDCVQEFRTIASRDEGYPIRDPMCPTHVEFKYIMTPIVPENYYATEIESMLDIDYMISGIIEN